jgi:thiol-disulfide isomerase/thioredoxin
MGKKDVKRITEDFHEGDLPFNFEVKYTDADHFYVELINGTERIRCDSIRFWRMKNSAYDTLVVSFPHYQSYIRAVVRERLMEGEFVVTSKENYRIPFRAKNGISYRFTNMNEKPNSDLSGKWETTFGINDKTQEKAVGEFTQKGNQLTGTWRTETGDYRFLEGTIQGRKFWLSAFDGAHAFLFSGNIKGDTLTGEMRSGIHYQTLWTAKRNENFDIRPAESLTKLKNGASGIHFAYKTPEGRDVRMPDPAQKGKVKIVQIMGSWCPNCLDETEFLVDYFKKNPTENVQIIGLSWERGHNIKLGNEQVARYKKLKNIPYDLVYAGYASIDSVAAKLPELQNLMAFPTMILIDKNDKVRQIHTGFDGPASSKNAAFKADFDKNLKALLAE